MIKHGYNAWFKEWAKCPENRLFGMDVLSAVFDGEVVEIISEHIVNGEEFCVIKARGLGGAVHRQWLENLPEDKL